MLNGLTGANLVYLFIALLISVVLHELMHGVMAYWLGDTTAADAGRLTLNPLASIDILTTIVLPFILIIFEHVLFFAAKPVPFNPERVKWGEYGAALVGLAGPATNFVLALIGAVLFRATSGAGVVGTFADYFAVVNVGMMVFNLIPFPPLDGSRVLYAFAPEPLQELMARIEGMGFAFLLIILLVGFQLVAPFIANVDQSILQILLGSSV